MKKTVAIIGTNGLPGKYGGWDQLLYHLTNNLKDRFSFIVYTSYYNAEKGLKEYNEAKIKIVRLKANGVQSIFYDMISMLDAAIKYDILLVLGTSGCIFLPIIKLFHKKIILNPDGLEWKRKKWSRVAQWFLKSSENVGINYADIVISDNKRIEEYIYRTYKIKTELIEYGGDHVKSVTLSNQTRNLYSIENEKYAFKVCRIEPENNLDLILEAFKGRRLILIIVGNWNNSEYGKNLRQKYNKYQNLKLLDPIYEQNSLDELRSNCYIYIHGHSVGGTNPSLVEAMSLGLCPVVYDVEYNIETSENSAIYFNNIKDLGVIIDKFENENINTSSIKEKMKEIANRRYTWDMITEKYAKVLQSNNL